MGVGSEGLQGLTNDCVDISTRNTPGRSCRAVRREPRHSPSPRLSSTVNTSRSADSTTEDWYFHKLNTIVHVDLCANAWLSPFHPLSVDNLGKWKQPCVVLYLPIWCRRAQKRFLNLDFVFYDCMVALIIHFLNIDASLSYLSPIFNGQDTDLAAFSKLIAEICHLAPRQLM